MYKIEQKIKSMKNGKMLVSLIFLVILIISCFISIFTLKVFINLKIDKSIDKNYTSFAYKYFYNYHDILFNPAESKEKIIASSIKNKEYDTLFKFSENKETISFVKKYLTKENYKDYLKSVKKEYPFTTGGFAYDLYYSHYYFLALPKEYNSYTLNVNKIYNKIVALANLEKNYTYGDFWDAAYDYENELTDYLSFVPLRKELESNISFFEGYWSNNTYYFKVFKNSEDTYSTNYNLPAYSGEYYEFNNGIYEIGDYNEDYVQTFKFTILNKNKISVYCYLNKKTYVLYRG